MAEIINLRRARKAAKREVEASVAAVNRERFGQTAAAKKALKASELRQKRLWEDHKREPNPLIFDEP